MGNRPTITCTPNGPYLVKDLPSLRNSRGTDLPQKSVMALCRCGGSANKPFCDGTHARNGFSDARVSERADERRDDYRGRRITVHDDRRLCAHAGHCTDGLPTVFKYGNEPWIDPMAPRSRPSSTGCTRVRLGSCTTQSTTCPAPLARSHQPSPSPSMGRTPWWATSPSTAIPEVRSRRLDTSRCAAAATRRTSPTATAATGRPTSRTNRTEAPPGRHSPRHGRRAAVASVDLTTPWRTVAACATSRCSAASPARSTNAWSCASPPAAATCWSA